MLRTAGGTKWTQLKREAMCTINGKVLMVELPEPFGLYLSWHCRQMLDMEVQDLVHSLPIYSCSDLILLCPISPSWLGMLTQCYCILEASNLFLDFSGLTAERLLLVSIEILYEDFWTMLEVLRLLGTVRDRKSNIQS